MRIICPQCRNQLSIHRPSVAATRVKCRNCGHKFYAGKAEEVLDPNFAAVATQATPQVEAEPVAVVAPTEEAFDEERKKENRAANRDRLKQGQHAKRMRWLLPASVACLAVMILLGLFFAQKPPPAPAPPTTSLLDNSVDRRPKLLGKAPAVDSGSLVIDVTAVRRPAELIGMWTLQEPGGGTLDLRADGNVSLKAPMIDDKMLEISALWFVTKTEGQEYALEFGAEPHRTGNNRATVRLQSDGTLRFIRFISGSGLNFEPRIFKKS